MRRPAFIVAGLLLLALYWVGAALNELAKLVIDDLDR